MTSNERQQACYTPPTYQAYQHHLRKKLVMKLVVFERALKTRGDTLNRAEFIDILEDRKRVRCVLCLPYCHVFPNLKGKSKTALEFKKY